MPSYTTSSSYTLTTTTKTSEGTTSRSMRAASAGSDLDDLYFKSFCMSDGDRCRMGREFFSPAPISLTGNYWPSTFEAGIIATFKTATSTFKTGTATATKVSPRQAQLMSPTWLGLISTTRLQALTPTSMVTRSTLTLGSYEATMQNSNSSC